MSIKNSTVNSFLRELRALVRCYPLASYLALTFLISWGVWVPALYRLRQGQGHMAGLYALAYVGVYGPSLAALALSAVLDGFQGIVGLLSKYLIWRCHPIWYVVALLTPTFMRVGAALVSLARDGGTLQIDTTHCAAALPIALASLFGGPLGEELGWRGFALPRLRVRLGLLPSSILMGIVWGIWHLPAFVWTIPSITPPISITLFTLGVLANSVLLTWIVDCTGGSLLLAVLYHTSLNATASFLALLSPSLGPGGELMRPYPWILLGVALVVMLASYGWRYQVHMAEGTQDTADATHVDNLHRDARWCDPTTHGNAEPNMGKDGLYFGTASILLPASWLMCFFLLHNPIVQWLVYAGWVILAGGLVLIFLSIVALRSKGKPEKGRDFTHTTVMVDSGVYAIVRHPLYLGWLLVQVAVIFFSQHWSMVIMGALGAACIYLISRQQDRRLMEKFGDAYREYIQSVPVMNLLVGITRLWRQRKRDPGPGVN